MTVSVAPRYINFNGSGTTGPFTFNFPILISNLGVPQITVTKISATGVQTVLAYPADYSFVAASLGLGGGAVTSSVAIPADGSRLFIQAATPLDQGVAYRNQGDFFPETHEQSYDKLHYIVQEASYSSGTSIRIPTTDVTGTTTLLPSAAQRANLFLAFDALGNVTVTAGVAGPAGPAWPIIGAAGAVDAITATFSPALTLSDKTLCSVVALGANITATPTFAPNGLTAHTITKRGGKPLVPGDIAGAGFVPIFEYSTANSSWELLNPAVTIDPWVVATGSVDAIAATYVPAIPALYDGLRLHVRTIGANVTTTPTFSPNGLTARVITKNGGAALAAGDIVGNLYECDLVYNLANTRWELQNPSPAMINGGNRFVGAQRGEMKTIAYAATINLDLSADNNFVTQLTGNLTLGVPTNVFAGQQFEWGLVQDGTGSRTIAYAWPFSFSGGATPTASTAGGTRDDLYGSVKFSLTSVATVTIAAPGVFTVANHGMFTGQKFQLTTTGALPTGLTASTTYYVISTGTNTFTAATSLINAAAGTAITTTGSQSGTHTLVAMTIATNLLKGVA